MLTVSAIRCSAAVNLPGVIIVTKMYSRSLDNGAATAEIKTKAWAFNSWFGMMNEDGKTWQQINSWAPAGPVSLARPNASFPRIRMMPKT